MLNETLKPQNRKRTAMSCKHIAIVILAILLGISNGLSQAPNNLTFDGLTALMDKSDTTGNASDLFKKGFVGNQIQTKAKKTESYHEKYSGRIKNIEKKKIIPSPDVNEGSQLACLLGGQTTLRVFDVEGLGTFLTYSFDVKYFQYYLSMALEEHYVAITEQSSVFHTFENTSIKNTDQLYTRISLKRLVGDTDLEFLLYQDRCEMNIKEP